MPGKLYTWGNAASGRLGNNATTGDVLSPTQIGSDIDWDQVSAGNNFCVAIKDGKLYTWGSNTNGRTGLGTTSGTTNVPTQIGSDTDWEFCSAGDTHAAAIKAGKLYTWGAAASGGLGNNTTSPDVSTPTQIGSDTDWDYLSAGQNYTLAIKAGKYWAWGKNGKYQLGNGNTTDLSVPTEIDSNTDWEMVQAGGGSSGTNFSVGIRGGKLYSWGNNNGGQTGQGNGSANTATTTITQIGSDSDWEKVSACGSSGSMPFCLAIKAGKLFSWGSREYGTLGDGNSSGNVLTPTQVGSDTDWDDVEAGTFHSLGIKDGKLYSWGFAGNGRLGNGTTTPDVLVPTQVGNSTTWNTIAAMNFSAAIEGEALTAPSNTAAPAISGTAKVGETLTASDGTWTGNPAPTYGYQWKAADTSDGSYSNISGATSSTYELTSFEAGKYIKVEVTATNSEGSDDELSAATSQVLQDVANTALPTISSVDEVIQVGSELTSSPGTWDGIPEPTFTYQWQLSDDGETPWTNLSGATASSLTAPSEAGGKYLRLEVVATNSEGSATASSTAVFVAAEDEPEESGGNKSTAAIVGALRVSGAL